MNSKSEVIKTLITEFRKEAASNFYIPDYYAEALNEVADMLETPRYTSEQIADACSALGLGYDNIESILQALWRLDKKKESK